MRWWQPCSQADVQSAACLLPACCRRVKRNQRLKAQGEAPKLLMQFDGQEARRVSVWVHGMVLYDLELNRREARGKCYLLVLHL